jgi:hypothetical protein
MSTPHDAIAVNLVRLAGLDKQKARECEAIVWELLKQPDSAKLIAAADAHADYYEDQAIPAQDVRASITNAFYAGARYAGARYAGARYAAKSERSCRKCGGPMKPGKAMGQTLDCGDEGTCSPAGPGVVIDCMKCERCGWSVTS